MRFSWFSMLGGLTLALAPSLTTAPVAASNDATPSTRGNAVTTDAYSVWLETVGNYQAGKPGELRVVVEAKAPHKCNVEYPYKFTFGTAPQGVTYPTPVVHDMKVDGKHASMQLPIAPAAAGKATVQGILNFSVCTEDKCLIEKGDLSIPITIN
ncbi:MAG TPA: hypothetical protein VL137_11950 [Polyangiaceae bacterium]|nr:hypothetical protein [Polyangiaceae bacterium]